MTEAILAAIALLFFFLYQRSKRKQASIEYELQRKTYEKDYEDHKKGMDELGEHYTDTLEDYIVIRKSVDPLIARLRKTFGSNSEGDEGPDKGPRSL